jgi:hypothetical protein
VLTNGISDVLAFNYSRVNGVAFVNNSLAVIELCALGHSAQSGEVIYMDADDAESMRILDKKGVKVLAKFQNNKRISINE